MTRLTDSVARLNDQVAKSAVGHWFRLDGSSHPLARKGSVFTTELRAGLVTAAAMLYIISVNASILSASGGPCVCARTAEDFTCDNDPAYLACVDVVRRDYVTATSAISTIATFLMGLLANMPLGLAPGLGVNAYFAFSVVGYHGTGSTSYGSALGAVFLEGLIFFVLSIFGLRQWLGRILPRSISLATGVGIGLFLAIIGLGPNGIGAIGGNYSDLVGLGGCPAQFKDENGYCTGHVLQDPRVWLGVFLGGILTALLLLYRVRGAFLLPILLVAIASWPRNSGVTLFPHTDSGDSNFDFFKKVATWHSFELIGPKNINFDYGNGKVWLALISFLYIDVMDTTGTLYSMARYAGLLDDRTGNFEGSSVAFLVDAGCITIGSLMGLSPSTAFIESASGIGEGGKTGITAITTATVFFLSLFFAPIFASIPSWATGSTLILVGSLMCKNAVLINWDFPGDAIPAFVVLAMIPFSFNIAYGLIAGIITWILLHNIPLLISYATGGRVLPPGWHTEKEPYSIVKRADDKSPSTPLFPPWLLKLIRGDKQFWKMTDEEIADLKKGRTITAIRTRRAAAQRQRERDEMRNPSAHLEDIDELEASDELAEDGSAGDASSRKGGRTGSVKDLRLEGGLGGLGNRQAHLDVMHGARRSLSQVAMEREPRPESKELS
ncbi:hypothetical protein OC834_005038 [Tilletia horrida]|uniref:Xanthine/uracil permease n=1 Tax=Tilletia horrida TaxID=155126 RepID=A0AAN6GDP9_9BASI|nr:hypothetical protein OC834_005038 [Tilletia horrida]KAK0533434.1 hypothetical protein OC842_002975 [Tilletia horrida]KAK0560234.1 hypothetical protein OC844_003899 [Tilletia horrida]